MNKRFIVFIVEGKAEKVIIKKLINENLLIAELTPQSEYDYEIICIKGKDKLTYEKWFCKTNLEPKTIKRATFVVVGDKLQNRNHDFDNSKEAKENLTHFLGENYEEYIKYVTINPEPEYLIILKYGLESEFEKSKIMHPWEFITKELKISKQIIKSEEYWKNNFNDINELLQLIQKLKKQKNNNIINLIDIIK